MLAVACATTLSLVSANAASADDTTDPPRLPDRAALLAQESGRITALAPTLGAESAEKWTVRDVVADASGARHVRVDRTYRDLPVVGGDQIVHYDARGTVRSVDRAGAKDISPDSLTPKLTASQARDEAVRRLALKAAPVTPRLVVDATGLTPRLAYTVAVSPTGSLLDDDLKYALIDAETGKVIVTSTSSFVGGTDAGAVANATPPGLPPAAATANTYYAGQQPITTATLPNGSYALADPTRGNSEVLNGPASMPATWPQLLAASTSYEQTGTTWGYGTYYDESTKAAETAYGVSVAWDYFATVHGRNGVAADGQGIPTVMLTDAGTPSPNAAYSAACECMLVIDPATTTLSLTEREVIAHEFTHGVVAHTAQLGAVSEGSAINESMADIFGTMAAFHRDTPNDPASYLLANEYRAGGIRRMDAPVDYTGAAAGCWSLTTGGLEVHDGAGVGNHAFYLAAEGTGSKTINGVAHSSAACDGSSITGLGRDVAEKIWYRALTVGLTSTSDYHDVRTATVNAARDLYGDAEAAVVAAAWRGVGVNDLPAAATPDECVGSTSDMSYAAGTALADVPGPMGGATPDGVSVANNADGRLEVFALSAKDRTLWHRWQLAPNGGWSGWVQAGPAMACRIAVGTNADGRIELFGIRDGSREIWHSWQTYPSGPFSAWTGFAGPAKDVTVGRNADGRMEIFARNPVTLEIFSNYQVAPSAGWAGWGMFAGPAASVSVGRNADGRMEVFARNPASLAVFHRYQVAPNAGWSGWAQFSGPALDVTVATDYQGRQQIFARSPGDQHLWHVAQVGPNSGWSGWEDYSGAYVGSVRMGLAPWGLSVYITDDRKGTWELNQNQGVWTGWYNNSGPVTVAPTPAMEENGRANQFAIMSDGRVFRRITNSSLEWLAWTDFTV